MKSFTTTTTVQASGEVHIREVPFAPGTEVDVMIRPKRARAAEFEQTWDRVCRELRRMPQTQSIPDDDIQKEIDDYRTGR